MKEIGMTKGERLVARLIAAIGYGVVLLVLVAALGGCAAAPSEPRYNEYGEEIISKKERVKRLADACTEAGGVLWKVGQFDDWECMSERWSRQQLRSFL
jgi:hypothetical protein